MPQEHKSRAILIVKIPAVPPVLKQTLGYPLALNVKQEPAVRGVPWKALPAGSTHTVDKR